MLFNRHLGDIIARKLLYEILVLIYKILKHKNENIFLINFQKM